MFKKDDTVLYKGHGLVKIAGMPKKTLDEIEETYYLLKSARSSLIQTKLLVRVKGSEEVLRYPVSEQEAKELLDVLGEEAPELPEDPRERMQIIDETLERGDIREHAALVRDYRESGVVNMERPEVKKVKAISRNLAEELCHVLKVNRASLRGKLFVKKN